MAETTPFTKLLSLLLVLLLHFPSSASTIPLGSVLYASRSNQSWWSPNSTFSVSFVRSAKSPNSFLAGVFFSRNVPIWSAGTVDSGGYLILDSYGSLRLITGSNTIVWSSGTDLLGLASASIEDSGDLRLVNNRSITVWSSFDHPTDTIVQSQNFTLGMTLRSGLYSFQLESTFPALDKREDGSRLTLMWNDSIIYWNQEINSSFRSLNLSFPTLRLQPNGVVSMFASYLRREENIIYSDDYGDGSNSFRFLKVEDDGNLRIYSSVSRNRGPVSPHWSAVADQCDIYGYCGNFGICGYADTDTTPICSCPSLNFDPIDLNGRRKGCKRKTELSDCPGNTAMLDLDHTSFFSNLSQNSEILFGGSAPCRYNCLVSNTCAVSVSKFDGTGYCWQKQPDSFLSGYQNLSIQGTSYVKVCGPVLPNRPLIATEGNGNNSKVHLRKLKLILGVPAASVVMIIILVAILVRANKARKSDLSGENIEAVVMLKRYSYANVKKMTNSFGHVLGKGGFGTVYKGKLPEGNQDVAVKILKKTKGNGEEFINELASMSRTSHVNIVSLLGFCYEGNKRAIIYEFMPNGSLDKFLSQNMSTKMDWEKLNDIALGVSHGLEYLHNRCASRIVHFDIKPQNILMDKDLCPKIADFGLAKLCKNKESIVSMLDARGTVGYIAPEVFSNNFGGVSHKSDVYSYGMVVLEMIGARNRENVEHSGSNNSSMYFPDWIYKDFDRGENMKIFGDHITEEEEKIAKKLVVVGLWCIQTIPSDRPPMIKVIEMLEGDLESLQVPPKPFWGLPAVTTVPDTLGDSNEISSCSNLSQFDRGNSACEYTSRSSKEEVQQTLEESKKKSKVLVN